MIRAVIFDLDGTLIDSAKVWVNVDTKFFLKRGMTIPDGYADAIGHIGLYKAAIYVKETFHLEDSVESIIKEWLDDSVYEYTHNINLKPGAKEYLTYLKEQNIPFCVATANSKDCYLPTLKKYGIYELFDFILEVESFRSKEHPDIYLAAASRLGFAPSEILVCEDIALAIKTAHDAGFVTLAMYDELSTEEPLKEKLADYYVKDFREMIK